MKILLFTLLISPFVLAQEVTDPEIKCAQAVMGYLKQEGVIGGSSQDLCIGGLESLPVVNVGLGSDTFPVGDHVKFHPPSNTVKNMGIIKNLFSENASSMSFQGWADGINNKMDELDAQYSSLSEDELTKELSYDEPTLKAYQKLKADGKNAEATSLVRNHFLGRERARAVCSITLGEEKCKDNSILKGFASPLLESNGNLGCGNRRKAIVQFNGANFASIPPTHDGVFRPQFKVPEDPQDRIDMQLAAGANFFERLNNTAQSSDPSKFTNDVLEASMSPECQKDPGKDYMKDNFRLFLSHTKAMAEKSQNESLKASVFKGDYKAIKKVLLKLNEAKKTRALTAAESADMDLIDTVMTGYSRKVDETYDLVPQRGQDIAARYPVKQIQSGENQIGMYQFALENDYQSVYVVVRGMTYKVPRNDAVHIHKTEDLKKYTMVYENELKPVYKNYPKASVSSPSTDNLNCLSTARAVEEKIEENQEKMFYEPKDFVDADKNLKLEMSSRGLPQKGWVCQYCNSGIQVSEPGAEDKAGDHKMGHYSNYMKEFKSFVYVSREPGSNKLAGRQSMINQKNNKALTVGSMKTLGVYNISRSALGEKCPAGKSVCECMKDPSIIDGQLDKILTSSGTKKMFMNDIETRTNRIAATGKFEGQTAQMSSPQDQCLFVPPVPHSCKVGPSGASKDPQAQKPESALSCKLFDKIKKHPILGAKFDPAKAEAYSKIVLGNAVCPKDQAPENEARACAMELKKAGVTPPKNSSSSSKANHQ